MRHLQFLLFLVFSANGLAMLGWPSWWYAHVPGVTDTGPFNGHFVRDIGAAYVVCGLSFAALLGRLEGARAAAVAACAFLLIHAAIHLVEMLSGLHSFSHFLRDVPAVVALPLLALWSLRPARRRAAASDPTGGSYA